MENSNDKYFIALSAQLKNIMEQKNIEVVDLAAAANIDRKQIYRFINSENVPKITTLIRIILALGLEPKLFFDFTFDFKSYSQEQNIEKIKPKE
ncbi:helix-turn-helix domain-containing protein [Paenimyroides baculatum]|uniref:Helix-turn-helix transcriptional regulator n=1 Tax=Paenimyroides baculatum TaxID=2608000 RepID=A0A5M6CK24_9FLAO|nr:helix-turn-helix transcriptional regulator [Paenimyroides baculatum]KAA5535373.1 helix-turn-helix transcriptional regulator [Paenimyroides baculatum]